MNVSPAAFVVLAVVVTGVGVASALSRSGILGMLIGLSLAGLGPVIAFAGLTHGGRSMVPPFGDAVALVIIGVLLAQALVCLAAVLLLWRHEKVTEIDDLDEVAV